MTLQRGIDVSHWQGVIDWPRVASAGIRFAYLKASQGSTYVDPRFHANREEAQAAGLLVGAYHFAEPAQSVQANLDHFLRVVGKVEPDEMAPVLDLEDRTFRDPPRLLAWAQEYLEGLQAETGRFPTLYTSRSFLDGHLAGGSGLPERASMWVVRYNGLDHPGDIQPWDTWSVWQHTNKGQVPGIKAAGVDLDWRNLDD